MKRLPAIFLCAVFPISAFAVDNIYKIIYDSESLPDAKAGLPGLAIGDLGFYRCELALRSP